MKRKRTKGYANYLEQYAKQRNKLESKGNVMASEVLTEAEWKQQVEMRKLEGQKNINREIVRAQSYQYSLQTARRFRKTIKEHNLTDYSKLSVEDIRTGKFDLTYLNETLKNEFPDFTGADRAAWISYEVFGSE